MYRVYHANIKDWAKNYEGPLFDGILCDPPYELGFMGKSWDSSGIAFDTEMWADLFRHIKPGGHLLAFSGSRTYHRMAVAIEDAGFEIRDMIEWVYGSGFPKSLNIGKAVDKVQGNEREYIGEDPIKTAKRPKKNEKQWTTYSATKYDNSITKGTSLYEGYGTALKPAHEPCVLARKPISEKNIAENVLRWGTGGINIDASRVEHNVEPKFTNRTAPKSNGEKMGTFKENGNMATLNPQGRFPANFIHDGSDEVEAVFPNDNHRFFYSSKSSKSERNAGLEGFEEVEMGRNQSSLDGGKILTGSGNERSNTRQNHHPTVKPLALTKYLATLIKPPQGGRLLVPFSGSGSEMIGALQAGWEEVIGVELTEEYIPIAEARIKHWTKEPDQSSLL